MKTVYIFLTILCFISCSTIKETHYLSAGIENILIFPANKEDSSKIKAMDLAADNSMKKCQENKNSACYDDRGIMIIHALFPKGIYNFRIALFNNFKLPKNAKHGENKIRVTIGAKDNLENIEILKYTDEDTRKAIERVFRVKELNSWKSAEINGIPAKEQFEVSIFIK